VLLLYVDESGTFDGDLEHSILGGLALHVADLEHFRAGIEAVVADYLDEHNRHQELHANAMRSGSKRWRKIPATVRIELLRALTRFIGGYRSPAGHPYGLLAVIRSPGAIPSADPSWPGSCCT
jgi:hypothetical protein